MEIRDTGEQRRRRRAAGWLLLGVSVIWVTLVTFPRVGRWLGTSLGLGPRRLPLTAAEQRRAMPKLVFERINGGTWSVEEHLGEVVVINLWATWCGPCVQEMPDLMRVQERNAGRGFAVAGLVMDASGAGGRERVRDFVQRLGVSYAIVLPPVNSQMEMGLEGLPTTILIDRKGRVARTYVGELEEPGFEDDVAVLLGERGGQASAMRLTIEGGQRPSMASKARIWPRE